MNIYLLQYNVYNNRKIKGFETYDDYEQYEIASELNVNRSISDNLSCSITFNDTTGAISAVNEPNYCVITDSSGNIVSRWFVLDCKHKGGAIYSNDNRGGQYTIELKRDVIYDFHDEIELSKVLCNRGYQNVAKVVDNNYVKQPLFLNKDTDEFPLNSIKYKEVLLKEQNTEYDGPWLYFYRTVSDLSGITRIAGITQGLADLSLLPEQIFGYLDNGMITQWYSIKPNTSVRLQVNGGSQLELTNDEIEQICLAFKQNEGQDQKRYMAIMEQTTKNVVKKCIIQNVGCEAKSIEDTQRFTGQYSGTGGTYNVNPNSIDYNFITSQRLRDYLNSHPIFDVRIAAGQRTAVVKNTNKIYDSVGIESKDLSRFNTINSQFNIYAIPYPLEGQSVTIMGQEYTRSLALNLVKCLSLDSGCYDIQVLPYGPCKVKKVDEKLVMESDYITPIELWFFGCKINGDAGGIKISQYWDWEILKDEDVTFDTYSEDIYKIFLVKDVKRTFDISTPSEYRYKPNTTSDEDYYIAYGASSDYSKNKKGLNCYKIRLVSPDSQAIEEINPYFNYDETNNPLLEGFHIYMKYQPYSPYLQVLPIYKGYNKDFQDYRGLICGAGFSLAMASDRWAEYQAQNKNYKAQFDREVEGMEINMGTNIVNKMISGAAAGAMVGGAAGAFGGLAMGAINAGFGLLADYYNLETAKKEFRWNIENMQATPRTLKQIDAQNPNFRYYPYIECYQCTEDEKARLIEYLRHHGSKINAEGTFTDFIDKSKSFPYIECYIDEYHGDDISANVLNEINKELSMGIKYLI